MNDSIPYVYWYSFGGILVLALLSSFFCTTIGMAQSLLNRNFYI